MQCEVFIGEQAAHDLQVLRQPADPTSEWETEGVVLGWLVAGADAQHQPPVRQLLQCGGHPGQHGRVPKGGRQNHAADLYAVRGRTDRRHQRPRLRKRLECAGWPLKVEVIRNPHGIESQTFRQLRVAPHLAMVRWRLC